MKYALQSDKRIEATPKATGVCPCCGTQMIPKCGNRKVWHWAHKTKLTCDHWWENETQWHRDWKNQFPVEWQEVVHFAEDGEKHIADVKTNRELVIEFQNSYLKREEIEARSNFYQDIIWVVNSQRLKTDTYKLETLLERTHPAPKNEDYYYSRDRRWEIPTQWHSLKVPVFFDTGIEDWVIGHIPQRMEKFGFYKCHFLKKEYFIMFLNAAGRYRPSNMKVLPHNRLWEEGRDDFHFSHYPYLALES